MSFTSGYFLHEGRRDEPYELEEQDLVDTPHLDQSAPVSAVHESVDLRRHIYPIDGQQPGKNVTLLRRISTYSLFCPPALIAVFALSLQFVHSAHAQNKSAQALLYATSLAPTILPMLSSAININFIRTSAENLLELGTTVGQVETLLACGSLFDSVAAPFRLGCWNLSWLTLLGMWVVTSPLAGQAALRAIFLTAKPDPLWSTGSPTSIGVVYLNTTPDAALDRIASFDQFNDPLLVAAATTMLVSFGNLQNSSKDLYGNPRVPYLSHMPVQNSSSKGLAPYTALQGNLSSSSFPSLLGLSSYAEQSVRFDDHYILGYSFNVPYTYARLDCGLSRQDMYAGDVGFPDANATAMEVQVNACNGLTAALRYERSSPGNAAALTLRSVLGSTLSIASCPISYEEVKVQISCLSTNCTVTGVSPIEEASNADQVSDRAFPISLIPQLCSTFLPTSDQSGESLFRMYLTNPELMVAPKYTHTRQLVNLSDVDSSLISVRLTQLLNGYWSLYRSTRLVTGWHDHTTFMANGAYTDAVVFQGQERLVTRMPWVWVLYGAAAIMTVLAMGTIKIDNSRSAPNMLDTFNTRLQPGLLVDVTPASVFEEGTARAQRLRFIKVRLCKVGAPSGNERLALVTPNSTIRIIEKRKTL